MKKRRKRFSRSFMDNIIRVLVVMITLGMISFGFYMAYVVQFVWVQ